VAAVKDGLVENDLSMMNENRVTESWLIGVIIVGL